MLRDYAFPQARLWDGIDTGSWSGSHYYGVPEGQQEAARETAKRNAAAAAAGERAATASTNLPEANAGAE